MNFLIPIIGVIASWAVMKSQLSDLRERVKDLEAALAEQALKVQRLETQHEGTGRQLDEALRKLEQVTKTLQDIALDIARNSPSRV